MTLVLTGGRRWAACRWPDLTTPSRWQTLQTFPVTVRLNCQETSRFQVNKLKMKTCWFLWVTPVFWLWQSYKMSILLTIFRDYNLDCWFRKMCCLALPQHQRQHSGSRGWRGDQRGGQLGGLQPALQREARLYPLDLAPRGGWRWPGTPVFHHDGLRGHICWPWYSVGRAGLSTKRWHGQWTHNNLRIWHSTTFDPSSSMYNTWPA